MAEENQGDYGEKITDPIEQDRTKGDLTDQNRNQSQKGHDGDLEDIKTEEEIDEEHGNLSC